VTVCGECHKASQTAVIAQIDGDTELRRCFLCGCINIHRIQQPRGLVARHGLVQCVVEISGELESA
jgi:hypothetical protein